MAEIAAANSSSHGRRDSVSRRPTTAEFFAQGMEHYEGDGAFDESRDLRAAGTGLRRASSIVRFPSAPKARPRCIARLASIIAGAWMWPSIPAHPEGVWLRAISASLRKIPYYAFSRAIPGKATAAHIHIGPGSTRLSSWVSNRSASHPHSAD